MTGVVDEDKIVVDLTNLSQDAAIWGLEALAEQYVNYDEEGRRRLPIGQNKKWLQVLEYALTKIHQAAALKEKVERLEGEVEQLKKAAVGRWRLIQYNPKENITLCTCESCQSITYVPGSLPAQYCSTCGAQMENDGRSIWKYGIN